MRSYDVDEESSDSDLDDLLRDDIESLSRACIPNSNAAMPVANEFVSEDADFDDLELVRSIQKRYGDHLLTIDDIKPLQCLPPSVSDDDGDDYGFYNAVKERFSQQHEANDDGDDYEFYSAVKERFSQHEANDDESIVGDDEYANEIERELNDTVEGFPWAAQTLRDAIEKNRYYQKFLRNKLLHIEAKMEEIKELRKRIKTACDFQVQCKRKIGKALSQKQDARIQLILAPKHGTYAKGSAMCYVPDENSYVACYKTALEKHPISFCRDKWSLKDRQNLEKGIIQQYKEKMFWNSGLSIKDDNITPETMQCFSTKVNWGQLGFKYLDGRSGEECETRWWNHENRLINSGQWTREEEKKLLSLIEENGLHSWSVVAEKLGSNRTGYQCLARYQRSLNASILKSEWTKDEDAVLISAVESFGESNWQAVASMLERRNGVQCSNRWKKTLHPNRERVGKWGDDEDKRLKVAVSLFGKSWHRIAKFVPGRTQVQCRERWVNSLDPSLKHYEWSEEEDAILKEAIAEHGHCWSKVAACVPKRTDNQCLRRWKWLFPLEVPRLKAARTIRKVSLISNFVDREEERPTLGPSDFLLISNDNSKQSRKRQRKRKNVKPPENSSSNSKKRKVATEQLEDWESLPLSVVFKKALKNRKVVA